MLEFAPIRIVEFRAMGANCPQRETESDGHTCIYTHLSATIVASLVMSAPVSYIH